LKELIERKKVGQNIKLAWNPNRLAPRLALVVILLLSASLNLFRLHQVGLNGVGNAYYAAAVQTMGTAWRHFFYLAVDPAGFVALDKAPLSLWIQTASAKLFGFHGLSLLLPQALAGILAVYVLYRLVRRAYGEGAGLLAALTLAVMPISVVTNRTNFPDPLLILTLLLAAGAVTRAVEEGALRWLLAGGALVGVAFNVKMLQMLLVLPALAALFLFGSSLPWRRRFKHAAGAALVTLAVALPWMMAVELTPPEQRPYVGGSATNSVVELVFGYNGIARLWDEDWSFFLGVPGPLRLFNAKLAGQVSWLLPFAIVGLLAAVWQVRRKAGSPVQGPRRRHTLMLWTVWLVFPLLYFSVSRFYHRYYFATLAPAIAAWVGIGANALWSAWQTGGWRRVWMVVALLGAAGVQAQILSAYPEWHRWLTPLVVGLSLAAVGMLLVGWRKERSPSESQVVPRWSRAAFSTGILALLVAPAVWTILPVVTCTNMTLPYGGPQASECKPFKIRPFLDRELVAYLERHRAGARFLAATYEMGIASLGILETGEPFMALGGYRGSDPILTVDQFAARVADGEVRFFLSLTETTEEFPQQEAIIEWVMDHCPLSPVQSEGVEVRGPCAAKR
jgi:4-amino-4-deoxy-L-arabinose transferase-like glycosyltransferase